MKKTKTLFFLMLLVVAISAAAGKPSLRFKDNKFKIVQFTDLHWSSDAKYRKQNDSTLLLMKKAVESQKPDLVILTGDVVVSKGALKGWEEVTRTLTEQKVPFAVTFGNHDTETDMTKEQILAYLQKNSYNLTADAGHGVEGVGNCVLPVRSSDGKTNAWVLYLLDSHAYTGDSTKGYYDWVKKSQIDWYVGQSKKLAAKAGKPVPALAFFHIPVPEYEYVRLQKTTPGNKTEQVCSPLLNSGLFFSFVQQKDVKAIFVGHDHNNDFVGTLAGIKLCYGRKTGYVSYGFLERGARVIEISENTDSIETSVLLP